MFLIVRRRAEHIAQLPRLKVTLEAIFIKFHPNIPLIKIMCSTYGSATHAQGQGHN